MTPAPIPFESLETLFLDVGNTLISMDYRWIAEELDARGIDADEARVHRAEAASRPSLSRALAERTTSEGVSTFALYLGLILGNLGLTGDVSPLVSQLVPVFRGPGPEKLWTRVLPGIPEALARLRALGIELVAVSNSDGSAEAVLERVGLRPLLRAVFDSHEVGFEKPDPRIFFHALEKTGTSAGTTLHVGDLYGADVEGGRAAGLHTALLDPFGDWESADCHRYRDVTSLVETLATARRS
jgi:FMN phosphatase YigB (HAD superfamily)